ncbi:TPM domain-containing protein [Niabella beijingensis]|uniref:TPM domain-containing protein n=1 Tax=Niabella beijingensis TaxID=2872700 RepID=UPI001CC19AE5|nr:TPM domain-containing protein [Niabella beijingensis]MBZ4189200.1 TPM domain-containing protein [Niabella beijingensis]
MQQKVFSGILFLTLGLALACNPGKNLNTQVHNRDAEGRKTNIQYPKQPTPTPDNINMSYDFEQLFTPAQNHQIDSLVRLFEKSNLIAIKVITLPADRVSADQFASNNKSLLEEWAGVHGNTDKAMVVTISKALNKVAVDYGPFVEKLLSKAEADQIISNDFQPALQSGAVFEGTWKGVNDLMDTIRKNIK